jgi:hypothetical protein
MLARPARGAGPRPLIASGRHHEEYLGMLISRLVPRAATITAVAIIVSMSMSIGVLLVTNAGGGRLCRPKTR